MLKVNNRNSRKRCEICSKLTIKTSEQSPRRFGAFIVNFEYVCWNRNSGNTVKHECELHTECDQLSSPYKLEKQSFRGVL